MTAKPEIQRYICAKYSARLIGVGFVNGPAQFFIKPCPEFTTEDTLKWVHEMLDRANIAAHPPKQEPVDLAKYIPTVLVCKAACKTILDTHVLEAFLTALNLARDTKQEPSVPDGWKLVPLSPTKEMIDAIHNFTGWKDAQPDGEYDGEKTTSMYAMHVAAYKVGVKAAPVYMKLIHAAEKEQK